MHAPVDLPTSEAFHVRVVGSSWSAPRSLGKGLVAALAILIRTYQVLVRPHLFGACKFCPTCSEYALESLRRHGLLRGLRLSVRRVIRCHPFGPGGIDPVPME